MNVPRKHIYFASDAHLGARFHQNPQEVEKKLVRWLDSIKEKAIAIYFLGDMFDYWFEYKYVVPKGFVRFLGKLAELSDSGVEIHMFIGNHDIWMFDYLPHLDVRLSAPRNRCDYPPRRADSRPVREAVLFGTRR